MNSYLPSPALQPFIERFLIIESEEERVNRVLPGTSLMMAFRYKGGVNHLIGDTKTKLPSFMISGLRKSGRLINYQKNTGNILVQLKEAGAHVFIKESLHELSGDSVSLNQLTGYQHLSEIEDQLASATDNIQRIGFIEQFLFKRLCHYKPDELVLKALQRIHSTKGSIRIKELADTLYISQDALEKRFRKIVGVSPKSFSYIVRMGSVIEKGIVHQSLSEVAFQAGYFDQAHFNKDFKLFTGQTPGDFFKSPRFW